MRFTTEFTGYYCIIIIYIVICIVISYIIIVFIIVFIINIYTYYLQTAVDVMKRTICKVRWVLRGIF